MCSSILGPATTPSFVTCPTINIEILSLFASCIRTDVDSLTWLTLPGADAVFSQYIVCIESIITTSGIVFLTTSSITSRFVSQRSDSFSENSPILSARSFICLRDSSPDMYKTFFDTERFRHT